MTDKAAMLARNKAICDYYATGRSISECSALYGLRKQRVLQIVKNGGVWKRQQRGDRTSFLGVVVSPATKDRVQQAAAAAGKSVSRWSADALDEATK